MGDSIADSCIPWRSRPASSAAALLKEMLPNAMAAGDCDSLVRRSTSMVYLTPSRMNPRIEPSSCRFARSSSDEVQGRLQLNRRKPLSALVTISPLASTTEHNSRPLANPDPDQANAKWPVLSSLRCCAGCISAQVEGTRKWITRYQELWGLS